MPQPLPVCSQRVESAKTTQHRNQHHTNGAVYPFQTDSPQRRIPNSLLRRHPPGDGPSTCSKPKVCLTSDGRIPSSDSQAITIIIIDKHQRKPRTMDGERTEDKRATGLGTMLIRERGVYVKSFDQLCQCKRVPRIPIGSVNVHRPAERADIPPRYRSCTCSAAK